MPSSILEAGIRVLSFSRQNLLNLAEDIPADKLCYQPFAGANHALWVLGHLANADDYFRVELGKQTSKMFEQTKAKFFMGSKPSPKASDYPPLAEIKSYLAASREGLIGWFRSLGDSKLAEPLPEEWKPFAATYGDLMFSIAWHEGLHTGQLTAIRKSLGLAPKFG